MKKAELAVKMLFCTVSALLFLVACGDGSSSGGGSNTASQIPSSIVGKSIEFTVRNSGTAGIPTGYKIRWDFGSGGQVQGHNPVTGQTVTPNDYSYALNGTHGVIRVNYVQGTQTAYEIYDMTGSSSTAGTYDYTGDTGTGAKFANGEYVILN